MSHDSRLIAVSGTGLNRLHLEISQVKKVVTEGWAIIIAWHQCASIRLAQIYFSNLNGGDNLKFEFEISREKIEKMLQFRNFVGF